MKLLSPKGMDVRPLMEVEKGAAFDILQAAGGCPASLRPGRWLDLYSGTGSVGIEALSRGYSLRYILLRWIHGSFQMFYVQIWNGLGFLMCQLYILFVLKNSCNVHRNLQVKNHLITLVLPLRIWKLTMQC
nr:uncharacterized protein LOC103404593 [Malus domestica]